MLFVVDAAGRPIRPEDLSEADGQRLKESYRAHFDHFCCLEGDENVSSYTLDLTPLTFANRGETREFKFDAQVILREGRSQLHEICRDENTSHEQPRREGKREAAEAAGLDYVAVTSAYLADRAQLLANWRHALAFLATVVQLISSRPSSRRPSQCVSQAKQ